MTDSIHHIAIQVDNIASAVDWYSKEFSVNVSYQDESWAMLDFENISLALVLPGQHPPHFAVASAHPEKYGALTTHRDGTESIYIKDPFGNALELIRDPA